MIYLKDISNFEKLAEEKKDSLEINISEFKENKIINDQKREEELFSKEYLELRSSKEYWEGKENPPEMKYLDNGDCVFVNAECSLEITVTKPTTEKEKKYCLSSSRIVIYCSC